MIDERIIAELKAGNVEAQGVLIERFQTQAVRTAYLITRDRTEAEDIAQSAFLQAFEKIRQFDASRPFEPWFLKIVVNSALKHLRSRKLIQSYAEAGISFNEILERTTTQEVNDEIWNALGKLPPTQRAAIVLRYYLGFSESEIAAELGCSSGTVKSRLHQARKQLKGLLSWSK